MNLTINYNPITEQEAHEYSNKYNKACKEAWDNLYVDNDKRQGKEAKALDQITTNLKNRLNGSNGNLAINGDFVLEALLSRSSFINSMLDTGRDIDKECGYPRYISPWMYRLTYDREALAQRIVGIFPDETWALDPAITEDENDEDTEFEAAWNDFDMKWRMNHYMWRMDVMSGIGHFGILLLGLDDGKDLHEPLGGLDNPFLNENGEKNNPNDTRKFNIIHLRPFDESMAFISAYQVDPFSPRYGLPVYYTVTFVDMQIDAAGIAMGTNLIKKVHWTRVIHISDNRESSDVFGVPRQQAVFNRILDIRKTLGGSAEMFWKGAFPGISFEISPQVLAEFGSGFTFDQKDLKEQLENYMRGLQRYLSLVGVSAKSLAPQVADPRYHIATQMQILATCLKVPYRILIGSEEGRLASNQDIFTWNKRIKHRQKHYVDPFLIRQIIDRFILYGILPKPKSGKYKITWPDMNIPSDLDKANVGLKRTQALFQYYQSGMQQAWPLLNYLQVILGMSKEEANKITENMTRLTRRPKEKVTPPSGGGQGGLLSPTGHS